MRSTSIHAIVALSLCVAALVGHGFWYIVVTNKSAEVTGLQNQIDAKAESVARTASARTALSEISGDESVVQSYFVQETGVVSFIDNLETRARAQTATVKVLSVSVDNAGKQSTLAFSLTINGTFDAVMRTIGAIEYAPYNLSISKLSLRKDEKKEWHSDLELIVSSVPANTTTNTP